MPAFIAYRYGDVKSTRRVIMEAGNLADGFLFGQAAHMLVVDIDAGINPSGVYFLPAFVKKVLPASVLDNQIAVDKSQVRQELVTDTGHLGHNSNGHACQQEQAEEDHCRPGAAVFFFSFVFRPGIARRRR